MRIPLRKMKTGDASEGKEAKAWREIAENVERHHGEWSSGTNRHGLCCAVLHVSDDGRMSSLRLQSRMERRARLFVPDWSTGYWWNLRQRSVGTPAKGRTLAAWFLYWMAREEGK